MGLLKVDIPAWQTEVSFGTFGWCALRGPTRYVSFPTGSLSWILTRNVSDHDFTVLMVLMYALRVPSVIALQKLS